METRSTLPSTSMTSSATAQPASSLTKRTDSTSAPTTCQSEEYENADDTLVVWRLDRLGRSLPDLVRIVGELERGSVGFESIAERIETSSASGKLAFHAFAPLAEFERNLIRERTCAWPQGRAQAEAGRTGDAGDPCPLT